MNRRTLCIQLASSAFCAAAGKGIAQRAANVSGAGGIDGEAYELWSLLIPFLQSPHSRGYLIAAGSAVPNALPNLEKGPRKSPIQRAMDFVQHPDFVYSTLVPAEWQTAFVEAVAEAKRQQAKTVTLDRRFAFKKRYRLLTADELKAYFALSPHITSAGWRPDPKVAKEFKGWDAVSFVSLPAFDSARRLAMIWATTESGCGSSGWYFFARAEHGWARQEWDSERPEVCA